MKKQIFFLVVIFFLAGCRQMSTIVEEENSPVKPLIIDKNQTLTKIAFGSCNKENRSQSYWTNIVEQQPQLWIWLGDNVYGDTEDMEKLKGKYDLVKSTSQYRSLISTCPIIGIWDDHDYGVNDGGKSYAKKEESKDALLEFLDVPSNAAVRNHKGVYQSFTIGEEGKKVKIILLDTRSFRDDLEANPSRNPRYLTNETGDILGDEQWAWLESELTNSDADLHLIASGYQVIPEEQIYEKWSNFPMARKRLFDLLASTQVKNPILLSGDRHISELSKIEWDGMNNPVYEFTSSGLTHTWTGAILASPEPNRFRVGEMVIEKSFGMLYFDWGADQVEVTVQARDFDDKVQLEKKINFGK